MSRRQAKGRGKGTGIDAKYGSAKNRSKQFVKSQQARIDNAKVTDDENSDAEWDDEDSDAEWIDEDSFAGPSTSRGKESGKPRRSSGDEEKKMKGTSIPALLSTIGMHTEYGDGDCAICTMESASPFMSQSLGCSVCRGCGKNFRTIVLNAEVDGVYDDPTETLPTARGCAAKTGVFCYGDPQKLAGCERCKFTKCLKLGMRPEALFPELGDQAESYERFGYGLKGRDDEASGSSNCDSGPDDGEENEEEDEEENEEEDEEDGEGEDDEQEVSQRGRMKRQLLAPEKIIRKEIPLPELEKRLTNILSMGFGSSRYAGYSMHMKTKSGDTFLRKKEEKVRQGRGKKTAETHAIRYAKVCAVGDRKIGEYVEELGRSYMNWMKKGKGKSRFTNRKHNPDFVAHMKRICGWLKENGANIGHYERCAVIWKLAETMGRKYQGFKSTFDDFYRK